MDIQTIVFIIALINVIQLIIFYHQYKTNKTYKGIGWWLLWISFETLGFGVVFIRSFTEFTAPLIILQNLLIIFGTLFIYVGLMSFLEKKVRWDVITVFSIMFSLFIAYFTVIDNNIKLRTIGINFALSAIAVFTTFSLRNNTIKSIRATLNFIIATFIVHALIFFYIGSVTIFERRDFNTFSSIPITILQFSDALVVGLLWTFGFIIMLNQRLSSELKESKEHFEEIFYTTPDMVIIADLFSGNIIDVNDIFEKLTGFRKDEALGKSTLEIGLWAEPEKRVEVVKIITEGKQCINKEFLMKCKNGEIKTILFSAKKVSLNGKDCLMSIVKDITELKKEEEEKRLYLAKYKVLFDSIPVGITVSDRSGKIIESNAIAEKLLGLSKEEQLKREIDGSEWKFIDTNGNNFSNEEFPSVIALKENKLVENIEMGIVKSNNKVTWINVTAAPIPIENYGVVIVYIDITERKKTEEIIRESEARLTEAQRAAKLGSWEWDMKTNELVCSDEFLRIFGFKRETFNNNADELLDRIHPDDKESYLLALEKAITSASDDALEYRVVTPDGNSRTIYGSSYKVLDKDNNPVRAIGTVLDITERKKIEEEIRKQNEELQRTNAEKDKFFSIIAHDLRSPFNGLLGLTEMMAQDIKLFSMSDIQDLAAKLNESAANLYRLLNNLLEWSRMQRGTTEFHPSELDLKDITETALDLFKETASGKGVELSEEIPYGLKITADKSMIESILRNLVSNSIKFTEKGGKVSVAAERTNGNIKIEIKDTGIGMEEDILNNLFKIDTKITRKGTNEEPGTGLGLMLSKEFIAKHNGKIQVTSKPGEGSTFSVIIPANQ